MKKDKVIKAYKGFNIDMTCNNFQYEEGKEYETDKAQVCKRGFHACEYPLDCLQYYNPARSVFHEVEQSGSLSRHNENTEIASTKIKIGGSISIEGLVKAAIEYTTNKNKENYGPFTSTVDTGYHGASLATGHHGASTATGNYGVSTATGDFGASAATGDYGVSTATGYCGASAATGYCGVSTATGYCGASTATGYCGASAATAGCGASTATGNFGVSTATGNYGVSTATGNFGVSTATGEGGASSVIGHCGVATVTGYCGMVLAENKDSIAIAWGYKSIAKGVLGSYLAFADWEGDGSYDYEAWVLKGAKLVQVDGKNVKADTWYIIENGEIIEAPESE